jgi:hypothetical protein
VVFEIEDGERGLKASQVRLAEPMTSTAAEPTSTAVPIHAIDMEPKLPATTTISDDRSCFQLPVEDLRHEVTEALLGVLPTLTGDQILHVRSKVIALAATHHWLQA